MNLGINAIAFALISGAALPGHAPLSTSPQTVPTSAQVAPAEATSPHEHFKSSLRALAEKDYRRAAAEIRNGEALLEREAGHAANEARAALEASADELKALASEVESGAMQEAQTLESAFGRAERALAAVHRERSSQSDQASPFDYGA